MLKKIWASAKRSHFAMMAVCCILPIIAIFALQAFGFNGSLVFAVAIAVCIGSHLLMGFFGARSNEKACH
ncbi:MAG TPA: hypothetical protein VI977_01140 [archaeon]|nr:hypothetical protein [archaeon]